MVKVLFQSRSSLSYELRTSLEKHWELVTKLTNVVKAYKLLAGELGLKGDTKTESGHLSVDVPFISQSFSFHPLKEAGFPQRRYKSTVDMWLSALRISYSREKGPDQDKLESWFQSLLQLLESGDLQHIEQDLREARGKTSDYRADYSSIWLFIYPERLEEHEIVGRWLALFESNPDIRIKDFPLPKEKEEALPKVRKLLSKAEQILKSPRKELPQEELSRFHSWANLYFFLNYWFFLVEFQSRSFSVSDSGTFLNEPTYKWLDNYFYKSRAHVIGQVEFLPSADLSNPMVFHLEIYPSRRSISSVNYHFPHIVSDSLGEEVTIFFPSTTRFFWRFGLRK